GDSIIPATEPNWSDVSDRCVALLSRTKDLRIVMQLILAQLRVRGMPGLRDGLTLLRQMIERHWSGLHPQLDPDDASDPAQRMTIVSALSPPPGSYNDAMEFRRRVREAVLVQSRQFGRFS